MLIRIKKLRDGAVLACTRDGPGAAAVQRTGGFFALHDLMHYAVETVLGYDRAFFGLMAAGWSFENFTRRDDPAYRPLPEQAILAEHMVATFTRHLRDSTVRDPSLLAILVRDINQDLAASLSTTGIPAPALDATEIAAIFDRFDQLAGGWAQVEVGGHLELPFPA